MLALQPTDWVPTRLRTGMLIARACPALGDEEGAQLELESARELFAELGAIPAP